MKHVDINFSDSLQVEESFYHAFRTCNITLMRKLWATTDEVVCIHPGTARIYSFDLVIASWEKIFAMQTELAIEVIDPVYTLQHDLAVHHVKESLNAGEKHSAIVYATNVYKNTQHGWKMVAHHASASVGEAEVSSHKQLH